LQNYVENNILGQQNSTYQNNKAIGDFLVSRIYKYGDLLPWEQLIERATGEPLNPLYFSNYLTGGNEEVQKIQP
jgi:Zn-dependent M32 family carboxypeptidase